jgi:peptidyl-prolyl cis-trans isomerase A (cyclophilin A)
MTNNSLFIFIFIGSLLVFSNATDPKSPSTWCLEITTNEQISGKPAPTIVLNVTRSWAPIGADHLYALVNAHFYDVVPSALFRVVPGFVVQFGISGLPSENAKWATAIQDDPVVVSNTVGTLSYADAGPNTRTTQLFINYVDNSFLDAMGFAPLAVVTSGMGTALNFYNPTPGNSNGVDQGSYTQYGNPWIVKQYPLINFIIKVNIGTDCPVPASTKLVHL